mmetsp:Transcript_3748/g.5413  ORF Transcript_3748/g.5413 Transcript_3748/m.5413 type:complete len:570 (-) Transcript_3748:154-1863(-)
MGQIFSSVREEEEVNPPPAKKIKTEDFNTQMMPPPPSSAKASKLISLLVELNGGKPLDLAVISAINSACSSPNSSSIAGTTTEETLNSTLNKLFTDHVGQSPQIVINHAIQFASDYYDRETNLFNETEMRGGNPPIRGRDVQDEWFDSPTGSFAKGPRPDYKVWLELFLGEERVEELLDGSFPLRELHDKDADVPAEEHVVWEALKDEVTKLPLCDLLLNVLSYVRSKSDECEDRVDILRFAVLYGLDGVTRDLIQGGYGDLYDDLTIDTLLELSDEPIRHHGFEQKFYLSPLHLGAILGYPNIVLTAINELEAKIDAPLGLQGASTLGDLATYDHLSPSYVMEWVILKNMKAMLKTLIEDCGFQFRWVFHGNFKATICKRIFELAEYEDNPRWSGGLLEEDYAFESSRVRRRMRSAAAYKEQMKMLDCLIDLGLPFALLFPTEVKIDELDQLHKAKKLETSKQNRDYMRSLSRKEREAIDLAAEMSSSYNSLKNSEAEMLTLSDYYRMLKKKWEGKESQVARLDEFEALDPTWRAERRRQEDGGREDEESDDEHSYGSGSSYEFPCDY